MHKLIRTIAIIVTLTTLFGAVIFTHAQMAMPNIPGQDMPIKVQETAKNNPGAQTVSPSFNPIPTVADIVSGIGGSFLGWIGLEAIGYVSFTLIYIAGLIGSTAFTLAGILVELGLYFNTTILNSPIVQLGWRFCRDLANLGFTIGIVVIAYATMLGIESYGMKKILINFAFAAIIVNFSFSIAGFAIDISNMLTHFFVNASIGGGGVSGSGANIHKFTETLASAFNPQKLLITDSLNPKAYESLADDGMIAAVLSIFFVALFTALAALGMLMVGLTTISRFIRLSGLVIVMPIAILCAAFPNTRKWWGKWYDDFFSQLTYLPIATFSMYLVIMFVQIKADVGFETKGIDMKNLMDSFEQAKTAGSGITATKTLELMAAPLQTITDMVLVLAMLFIGITKSAKLSGAGGDIALKWTTGLKDWAVGAPKGAAGWAGRKYLSGGGSGTKEDNRGTRLAGFLQRIPLISRFAPQINKFAAGTSKNLGNLETEYKGMGDVQLRNALYNPDIKLNPERMAAAAKEAVARGLLNNPNAEKSISQEKLNEFIPALKRYGFDEDIVKKAPYLYGKFGWDLTKEDDKKKFDGVMKAFKPEDMENLTVEAFTNPEIVSRFTSAHLEKLPKEEKRREAFAKTFNGLRESMNMDDEKFGQFVVKSFAKPEADAALLPALLRNPLVVKSLTNANLKKLAGSDKKGHREAFLETINDTSKFSDKDLQNFMSSNFANSKSIDEIHPDIIRNKRFFNGLDEKHIQRMNAEPDENQQEAMLDSLRASYKEANKDVYTKNELPKGEVIAKLDRMAKVIIDKKKDWQWSPLVDNPKTKEGFFEIENDYRLRAPSEEDLKQKKDWMKNKNDDDAYGPSAPTSPTQGPYPPAGGGPSSGNTPPKPPTPPPPPPPPYPAGAGPSVKPNTPTSAPKAATPDPIQPQKSIDIGAMMDAALKNSKLNPPSNIEINEEFPTAADRAAAEARKEFEAKRAKLYAAGPVTQNTPPNSAPPTNEAIEELERMTSGTPVVPPELNALAESEDARIKQENKTTQESKPIGTGRGWQPPEPIDAEWEPKNKLEYKGPLVPPEQKPTSIPEPIKTIVERERNANENQISVIPKFMPADQPKRIEYKGPVTPPPTPILQKEKDEKDNQVERKNTL